MMAPTRFPRSILWTALMLAAVPVSAQAAPGFGTTLALSDLERVLGSADMPDSRDEEQGGSENGVHVSASADGDSEDIEANAFYVATATVPTQSLTSVFNPATAHLNRSHVGATSRLVSAGWADAGGEWWKPSISYVLEQDRAGVVSGFGGADLSNSEIRSTLVAHNFAAEWGVPGWRVGYRMNASVERSTDASLVDPVSKALGRGAYFGWQLGERLEVQVDFGIDTVRDVQTSSFAQWRSRSLSAQWQFDGGYALSSSFYEARSAATESMPALRNRLTELTLSRAFGGAAARSGDMQERRAYLRLERQSLSGEGIQFSADTPQSTWSVTVGLSTTF